MKQIELQLISQLADITQLRDAHTQVCNAHDTVLFRQSNNVGGWIVVLLFPIRFSTSLNWKRQPRTRDLPKKKLIWCGLWAITLFQTVRTHLHQCCLCTARAVKETSVIMMQRTPRLDLPSGNRCHVGRAWQNIFWMWVTTFFVPDAACHVCCDVQVFNRCQSPGSSDIFQSPSGPIPKQLYVFNWYFVIFFCTIPHPVEKNCTNASCIDIGSAIYTTKRSSKTALSKPTMQVPKNIANLELPFESWISFHIILQDNERVRCTTINSWLLRPSRCRAPGFNALQSTLTIIDIVIALWVTHTGWGH